MTQLFERPYFVSPHAIKRFKERVSVLDEREIIEIIQALLQGVDTPVDAQLINNDTALRYSYEVDYNGKTLYLGVIPSRNGDGEWPVVTTVMIDSGRLHDIITRERKRPKKWREKDDKILYLLLKDGFTHRQCAKILRCSHMTINRHTPDEFRRRKGNLRRWTPEEKEKLILYYSRGWGYDKIAKKLGRSENAVKIQICRHRKRVMSDPKKVAVMKVLTFCMSPSRILQAVRESGLIDAINSSDDVDGLLHSTMRGGRAGDYNMPTGDDL